MARRTPPPRGPQLDLAGELSVAFVNTAGARPNNRQLGVGSCSELLIWGGQAGLLPADEAERLGRAVEGHLEAARAAYADVAEARAALGRVFLAISRRREPAAAGLAAVNAALAATMPAIRLVSGDTGLGVGWDGGERPLDRVLGPVLYSAIAFLSSLEGRPHVRRCAGPDCELFFVDRSPSGRRVWCQMKTCGHRVKSLRHYHRLGKTRPRMTWPYG